MKNKLLVLVALLMSVIMAFGVTACKGDKTAATNKPPLDNTDDTKLPGNHYGSGEDKDPGGSDQPAPQAVSKVTVKTNPTSTEYWVGDTLSLEGGILTVTYKDKTTKDIPMTDKGVTMGAVNMNVAAVSKTVKVTYGGKSGQFYIKVKEVGGTVTFDYKYSGSPSKTEKYEANKTIVQPKAPDREGFTFDKWYVDTDCTVAYDFDKINKGDVTLYACWKDNAKTYVDFTYDLNYYGIADRTYSQLVATGENSRTLGFTPERNEFVFDGWFNDAACTDAYAQGAMSANKTVYAKWRKTKQGVSTYKFEGENCDMDSQEGPGLSGSAGGGAMMVSAKNPGVSGKVVSYLYKEGLHVDFCLASNEDTVATLKVYVASEFNFNLNSSMYKMKLINSANENGIELEYQAVDMVAEAPVTCITIGNVHLTQGANVISLITANSANPTGVEGSGTYKGTAPMIDCIEIETTAVVTWDGVKGLPKQN